MNEGCNSKKPAKPQAQYNHKREKNLIIGVMLYQSEASHITKTGRNHKVQNARLLKWRAVLWKPMGEWQ